jgi:hypothetical protein
MVCRKIELTAIGVGLLMLSALADAGGQPVDESLDAATAREVAIDVVRGTVQVVGVDGDTVRVTGNRDTHSETFVFSREGDVIRIEDRLAQDVRGGDGTDISVQMPRALLLRANLVSADARVRGVHGGMRLRTVSGDVNVDGGAGYLVAASVSGDIEAQHSGPEADLYTVSGDIEAKLTTTRLDGQSVSGLVRIHNAEALRRCKITTVSGDIELTTAVAVEGELALESTSGDIALALRGEPQARLSAASHSGQIDIAGVPPPKAARGPSRRLDTTFGDGSGLIELSALSGDVTVSRD